MSREARHAARQVRRTVQRHVEHRSRAAEYASVVGLDPIRATLATSDITLVVGEDLILTQSVRIYDRDHTIDVGDTLVVREMRQDDGTAWVASDVVSDKDIT